MSGASEPVRVTILNHAGYHLRVEDLGQCKLLPAEYYKANYLLVTESTHDVTPKGEIERSVEFSQAKTDNALAYAKVLKAEIERKDARIAKLEGDIQCMIEKAADNHLEGYREMGRQLADKENRIEWLECEHEKLRNKIADLVESEASS